MRVIFFGTPEFAVPALDAVAERFEVALAVAQPDRPKGRGRALAAPPVKDAALARGIAVLQVESPNAPSALYALKSLAPDLFVVVAYGAILSRELLAVPKLGAINLHASLLPRHRGASPIQAALLAGDAVTGVSIQRIVAELDAGDVLLSRERPIGPRETAGELLDALAELAGAAAVEALDQLADGRARFEPQDPARVTVARKLTKAHGRIDWSKGAWELERFVRAMTPWPGARCSDASGRELTVLAARVYDEGEAPGAQPGELIAADNRLVVACGRGVLELLQIAPAGKRPMSGADYLRGARLEQGQRFGTPGE